MGLDISGVIIDKDLTGLSEVESLLNRKLSYLKDVTLEECLENFKDEDVCDILCVDGKTLITMPIDFGARQIGLAEHKVCSFVFSQLEKLYGACYTDNETEVYSFLSENKKILSQSGHLEDLSDLKPKDQVKKLVELVAKRELESFYNESKSVICKRYKFEEVKEKSPLHDEHDQKIEVAANRNDDDSDLESEALPLSTLIMLVCFFIPFVGPIYYIVFDKDRHHNSVVALWISLVGFIVYLLLGFLIWGR